MRLIDHLKALGHSNREAGELLKTGKVSYGGVPTADPVREVEPERVEVSLTAPRLRPGLDPVLLWRDAHLAIVWKPPGLLSVPAPGRRQEDNLLSLAGRMLGSVLAVHRLDEPTSGLMMIARTEAAQQALKDQLAAHDIERRYLAIVRDPGRFPEEPLTIDNHLVRDRGDRLRGSGPPDDPSARAARTHFRLVERLGPHHALVEAKLESGRTHQVRIHLAEAGFPVLGEPLYATASVTRAAPRLALHAAVLGLTHPSTGAEMAFTAPLADDLARLRRDLLNPRPPESRGRTRRSQNRRDRGRGGRRKKR